ncbi:MAG TPA: ABC transporter ATP-binding protein [Chloroflexota bacterium]|nr:ABC transporter ATP-binding protein [Chloroflexota bacterium]
MSVRVRGLGVKLGQATILQALDVDVEEGEFFTLLGPSGCGKTTFLRVLAGLERPTTGTVWIGDRVVNDPARGVFVAPEARDIGFVFQSYALWPHMTVAENVAFPLRARKRPATEIRSRVEWALQMVGLAALPTRPVTALSGGQQQRVAIARAIVHQPKLLLMDEPLSNLDADLRREVRDEVRRLQRTLGTTTIYVTHDQEEAFAVSDRIAVMDKGRILQVGAPQALYEAPRSEFVSRFLGQLVLRGQFRCDGGAPRLEIYGHVLPWSSADSVREGPVELCLDVGKLRLQPPGHGEAQATQTALRGEVERVTFAGRWGWRARVRVWGALVLELYTPSEVREGDQVVLAAAPGYLRVIGAPEDAPVPAAQV